MRTHQLYPFTALSALIATAILGCGAAASLAAEPASPPAAKPVADEATAFAPPSGLTAKRADGNIDLTWKNNATEPGGNWVEFTTPGDPFVKLDALWFDATSFHHPSVAPGTTFIYRIVPFFGRPSETVPVSTVGPLEIRPGSKLKEEFLGAPDPDTEGPLEDPPAGSELASYKGPKKSLRKLATISDAMPIRLTAVLVSTNSVDLRWIDRASDEDGYVVEISEDNKFFRLCALLPPDSTSFRKTQLPAQSHFRVRAFFYGTPSKSVSILTSPEPAVPNRTEKKPE